MHAAVQPHRVGMHDARSGHMCLSVSGGGSAERAATLRLDGSLSLLFDAWEGAGYVWACARAAWLLMTPRRPLPIRCVHQLSKLELEHDAQFARAFGVGREDAYQSLGWTVAVCSSVRGSVGSSTILVTETPVAVVISCVSYLATPVCAAKARSSCLWQERAVKWLWHWPSASSTHTQARVG